MTTAPAPAAPSRVRSGYAQCLAPGRPSHTIRAVDAARRARFRDRPAPVFADAATAELERAPVHSRAAGRRTTRTNTHICRQEAGTAPPQSRTPTTDRPTPAHRTST